MLEVVVRALVASWSCIVAGCAAHVAGPAAPPAAATPSGAAETALAPDGAAAPERWVEWPAALRVLSGNTGLLDAPTRDVLAEVARLIRAGGARRVRLRAEVRARSTCATDLTAARSAREAEIEDGTSEVYFDTDPQLYLDAAAAFLAAQGVPPEHVETRVSPRIRRGPTTPYARVHVFVDLYRRHRLEL